jgi:hypothetical protein
MWLIQAVLGTDFRRVDLRTARISSMHLLGVAQELSIDIDMLWIERRLR